MLPLALFLSLLPPALFLSLSLPLSSSPYLSPPPAANPSPRPLFLPFPVSSFPATLSLFPFPPFSPSLFLSPPHSCSCTKVNQIPYCQFSPFLVCFYDFAH
eukprot:TRINITY_DN13678_c0_g2_i3.p2 TRINITY_DN13678_c0_g2~~TRINITY_DN13678_c0_g2_i3.p2  ORF type:complete len:101 (-),score=14.54 TRINITY_DN13678_c0_g2_i3:37-339(-)